MLPPPPSDEILSRAQEVEGYRVLPPCVIYSKLGEGGMGAVYRGRHLNLDIDVAVKCLKPGLVGDDAQFVVRFQREARAAAQISHQNVIRVFDVAESRGLHYLIMEFVQGETARDRVKRKGRLGVGEALEIVYRSALGLGEAHRRGFVHRDIKPDNILISSGGVVKVADLGLAKPATREDDGSMMSMTGVNVVMGTPQYMPPEQWESAKNVTAAADVWALGATLYYLLCADEAIQKDSLPRIMQQVILKPFPDPRTVRADVPDDVAALIAKATASKAADRFADGQYLAEALEVLETRRQSLRDADAGTSIGAHTLVSPPPAQTLAKIRVRLDQKPSTDAQTMMSGPSSQAATIPGMAAGATLAGGGTLAAGGTLNMPRADGDSGVRSAPRKPPIFVWLGGGLLLAAGLWFALGRTSEPPRGVFERAIEYESAGRFADARAELVRVYGADRSLPGQNERLAELDYNWAKASLASGDWASALEQVDRSLAQRSTTDGTALRQEVVRAASSQLDQVLQRTHPSDEPVPKGVELEFHGVLASGHVAELLLGGKPVERGEDGSFRAPATPGADGHVAVAVRLVRGQEVSLAPWKVRFQPTDEVSLDVVGELTLVDEEAKDLLVIVAPDASLRIDGVPIELAPGTTQYRHRVRSTLEEPPPIEIAVQKEGFKPSVRTVAVKREIRPLTLAGAPVPLGGAALLPDGRIGVPGDRGEVRLRFSERPDELRMNGAPVSDDGAQANGEWTLSVPMDGAPSRSVALEARRRFRSPTTVDIELVSVPAQPLLGWVTPSEESGQTEAAEQDLAVRVDEWTVSAEARSGNRRIQLRPAAEDRRLLLGKMPLGLGANRIELELTDVLGRKHPSLRLVERLRPPGAATLATVVWDGGTVQRGVARGARVLVHTPGVLRVAGTDHEELVLVVDGVENVLPPGDVDLSRWLKEGEPVALRLIARGRGGASAPLDAQVLLDSTAPELDFVDPEPAVPGMNVMLRGTWSDRGGIAQVTVAGLEARLSGPTVEGGTGGFEVEWRVPAEPLELEVVALDRAGNRANRNLNLVPLTGDNLPPIVIPAGFEPLDPLDRNASGYPKHLRHLATGIELVAIGFANAGKPSFYAGVGEVTEAQWNLSAGSVKPKVSVTAEEVDRWCKDQGFALPTRAESAQMATDAPASLSGLTTLPDEWLGDAASATRRYLRSGTKTDSTLEVYKRNPQLGLRVVYRP